MKPVWLGLDVPWREALSRALASAVERDGRDDALPDSGEVWPVGDLPSMLWDSRSDRRFNLERAADRAAALAHLRAVDAEELAAPRPSGFRAIAWAVLDGLLRGPRFGALVLCEAPGVERWADGPFSRAWVERWAAPSAGGAGS